MEIAHGIPTTSNAALYRTVSELVNANGWILIRVLLVTISCQVSY
jgi:hypothetical protein